MICRAVVFHWIYAPAAHQASHVAEGGASSRAAECEVVLLQMAKLLTCCYYIRHMSLH